MDKDSESLLEEVQVHEPGRWENEDGPEGWFAVSLPESGIVAYFGEGTHAYAFRLAVINAMLNPLA